MITFGCMETIVKVKNTSEGKKLLGLLRTMKYVEVLDSSYETINVADLKARVKRAEKSKFYSLEDSMQRTVAWNKVRIEISEFAEAELKAEYLH